MWLEIANEPQRLDEGLHDLLDRIHQSRPGLGGIYLDALLGSVHVNGDRVTERPGSKQAASAASICLLRVLSRTTVVDQDILERYVSVIPPNADFRRLPCHHTMSAIHALFFSHKQRWLDWTDYNSHSLEYVVFADALERIVRGSVSSVGSKVPRWTLRFILHSLSLDPPPPTSVVTACLSIIAIDLGCDVSTTGYPVQKRYDDPLTCVDLSDLELVLY